MPLISDVVKSNEFKEDEKDALLDKLEGFNKLQKIDEFSQCFQLSIAIEINKFKRGYHTLDEST